MSDTPQWFTARDRQQAGPFDEATIRQRIDAGLLGRDDLVWRDGMPEWLPARRAGLFPAAVPPPLPA